MSSQDGYTVSVQYFALLREERGCREEEVTTTAVNTRELFEELRAHHGFSLQITQLKVVVNEEFCDWTTPLKEGDLVAFIPPVAGG